MALTTFQEIVLKAMQKMTPSKQSAVAQFAASLATKPPNGMTKSLENATQGTVPGTSTKTQNVRKNVKRSHPSAVAKPAKSSRPDRISPKKPKIAPVKTKSSSSSQDKRVSPPPLESELRQDYAKPDMRDNRWLFSENRRRESAPSRSGPSEQKWAISRWNHSGH
jgi:hypothetical protein